MRTRIKNVRVALPGLLATGAIAVAVAVAACGTGAGVGAGGRHGGGVLAPRLDARKQASPALPAGWGQLRLASGAVLPYPPGWRAIEGDRGSASAALFSPDGTIRDYLNATPADRQETTAGWTRFRLRHNAAEGDRNVRLISSRTRVRFAAGRASCVIDQYATSQSRYRELACILAPAHGGRAAVLVAAAHPSAWTRERPLLDFAVDHFTS